MNTIDILKTTKVDVYKYSTKSGYPWYQCSLLDFIKKANDKRQQILYLRDLNKKDEKQAKKYKANNILGCTVSCLCNKRRIVDDVKEQTGIISIDIDKDDNPTLDIEQAKRDVMKFPFVMLTMMSCRGEGIFCLIKYNKDNDFKETFYALQEDFKHIGYVIDDQCNDIVRLRLLSYDSNILIHNEVTEYNKTKEKPKPIVKNTTKSNYDIDTIWELTKDDLRSISTIIYVLVNYCNYKVDDYNDWLYEGFRLATIPNYDVGLKLFTMISQKSKGYVNDEDVKEKFDECRERTQNSTNVLGYYINKIKGIYGPEWKSVINELLKK